MNYHKHYILLIDRARNRILSEYTEKHHVVPKCMGGSNDKANLVRLTPEEHYVAHQLLVKMYPNNVKLIFAAHKMHQGRKNNKIYGWLKKAHAKAMSEKIVTLETRKKMSINNSGQNNPMYGKTHAGAMKNKKHSNTTKEKMSNSGKNAWTEERRKELSDKIKGENHPLFGKEVSIETRKKLSEARKGNKNSMYGKSAVKGSRWMNKLNEVKLISDKEIDNYLNDGWVFGRR